MLTALGLAACAATCSQQPEFDLVIRGGTVYDGSGETPGERLADVGIIGDRIRTIGDLRGREAGTSIDATGKAVAPGFIDAQSRAGLTLLADGSADNHLRQGITSEIIADGSPALWTTATADTASLQRYGLTLDWNGLPGYFTKLETRGIAINVGTLVPLSAANATGRSSAALDAAMKDGALGVLDDVHANQQEITTAAVTAGRYGGTAMIHSDSTIAASDDALVSVGSQVRRLIVADISHAPGQAVAEMVARLSRAIARNVPAVGTLTPYASAKGESDAAIRQALRFGGTLVVTDAKTMKDSTSAADTQPAAFGAFPRLFALARDAQVTELRDAIRRVTSTPATLYQLQQRGYIRENYFADLVVFDPQTIADRATFEKPNQYPVGIDYVIVNGVVELTPRGITGARAGSRLVHVPPS
ncbi:MAG TPA: amidohydrolase family protein [Vicinamibacterales bacterium]|nr:amidohydrolase family protein [Vicinamibacterales bacterium]